MKQQTARPISLGGILWLVGMLAIATGTGKVAHAATINYIIENHGGLYDFGAPGPLSVTGKFSFDTATTALSTFQLTFKADFNGYSALAGTYTNTSNPYVNYAGGQPQIIFQGPDFGGRLVGIVLNLSDFGDFGPYEILGGSRYVSGDTFALLPQDGQNPPTIVETVTGPTVREPSSWAMSLLALAGISVWMRQRSSLTAKT